MKTSPLSRAHSRGFTLVELLVVIAIIATLAGIAIPAYSSIQKKAKREQARTLATQLVNSIKSYYTDYNKYPTPPEGGGSEITAILTDETLTATLMGSDRMTNPKRIPYLPELRPVEGQNGPGLRSTGETGVVVDPWGNPYNVLMDLDYSNDVENPNLASGSTKLYQTVLVWSSGPDGQADTWEDNVTTWTESSSRSKADQQPGTGQ